MSLEAVTTVLYNGSVFIVKKGRMLVGRNSGDWVKGTVTAVGTMHVGAYVWFCSAVHNIPC